MLASTPMASASLTKWRGARRIAVNLSSLEVSSQHKMGAVRGQQRGEYPLDLSLGAWFPIKSFNRHLGCQTGLGQSDGNRDQVGLDSML